MKQLFLITVTLVSLCGCSLTAKMLGYSNPEIENESTLVSYMDKIGMETSNVITVDTAAYLPAWIRNQKSIPEAEIFDRRGRNLQYKTASQDCNAGVFGFIPGLKKDSTYTLKDSFTLSNLLHTARDMKGNPVTLSTEGYDYVVVLYWAKWTTKLNKDHINEWESLAINQKNARIKVIKLNLDFQEWWSDTFTNYVIARMQKKKS